MALRFQFGLSFGRIDHVIQNRLKDQGKLKSDLDYSLGWDDQHGVMYAEPMSEIKSSQGAEKQDAKFWEIISKFFS